MKVMIDVLLACAIVAVVTLASRQLQAPTPVVVWDAGQYYRMAAEFSSGARPYAESPYVFRVGVPRFASAIATVPARGFFIVNLTAAFGIAALLMVWLRAWGVTRAVALMMVGLAAAAWHGPARYIYYNPGYVDPPFIVLLLAGLLLIRLIAERHTPGKVVALALLSGLGALVRETMVLVPLCFLFVNAPASGLIGRRSSPGRVPAAWLIAPLAFCVAGIVWTHAAVTVDSSERASMAAAAFQWLHKPLDSFVMGWLATFGPVLAIAVFDWRGAVAFLLEHEWLGAFFAGCVVLSFIGGSDTERFAFWSLPVVYLVLARAIERWASVLRNIAVVTALVVTQAVSARVFWGIPDPHAESVVSLATGAGWLDRIYGIANRLFVIDSFHFNLWSSFGSRPFRLLRIGMYLIVMGGLVGLMALHDRKIALRPLGRAGHGAEHGRVGE